MHLSRGGALLVLAAALPASDGLATWPWRSRTRSAPKPVASPAPPSPSTAADSVLGPLNASAPVVDTYLDAVDAAAAAMAARRRAAAAAGLRRLASPGAPTPAALRWPAAAALPPPPPPPSAPLLPDARTAAAHARDTLRLTRAAAEAAAAATVPSGAARAAAEARRNAAAFDECFSTQYGARWPRLRRALLDAPRRAAVLNGLAASASFSPAGDAEAAARGPVSHVWWSPVPALAAAGSFAPPRNKGAGHGLGYAVCGAAALLPVLALECEADEFVLDLCGAGAGGRAVALAQKCDGGALVLNELCPERRSRLRADIEAYLPSGTGGPRVSCIGRDGTAFYKSSPGAYDRILCCVPNGAEGAALRSPRLLGAYRRPDGDTQLRLLLSAIAAVKVGGRVVYSTASIDTEQNDALVTRAIRRSATTKRVGASVDWRSPVGEPTKCGWLVLPDADAADGWGPCYVAVLTRLQ